MENNSTQGQQRCHKTYAWKFLCCSTDFLIWFLAKFCYTVFGSTDLSVKKRRHSGLEKSQQEEITCCLLKIGKYFR